MGTDMLLRFTGKDSPGVGCHFFTWHRHVGILISAHIPVLDAVDGVGFRWSGSINHVELYDMPLTDNGNCTYQLIVVHSPGGFNTHDIVRTLVTYNLVRRNVHELDILWHQQMRCHLFVDKHHILASVLVKDVAVREPCVADISCLLYTSPSPRDRTRSRMPSSA